MRSNWKCSIEDEVISAIQINAKEIDAHADAIVKIER
jgi:hypothetical protein